MSIECFKDMEQMGFEPTASSVRGMRSPSWATAPIYLKQYARMSAYIYCYFSFFLLLQPPNNGLFFICEDICLKFSVVACRSVIIFVIASWFSLDTPEKVAVILFKFLKVPMRGPFGFAVWGWGCQASTGGKMSYSEDAGARITYWPCCKIIEQLCRCWRFNR